MKLAYTSDTHVDFFKGASNTDKDMQWYIKHILKPIEADAIVIAGDISHYNAQSIALLTNLKHHYNHVIAVTGNHDMYLLSNSQKDDYNYSSFEKIQELREMCLANGIHLLDGESLTIDGVTIGGCPMWYQVPDIQQWLRFMNDGHKIFEGYPLQMPYSLERMCTFDPNAYYEDQLLKLKSLKNLDVFVSHVVPASLGTTDARYGTSEYDLYYQSDNIGALKETGAKYSIFGHSHCQYDKVVDGIRFLSSAIGYPGEQLPNSIEVIEITKETI